MNSAQKLATCLLGWMICLAGMSSVELAAVQGEDSSAPPDLTQGGKPDNQHRWTLGATGARGWVWSRHVMGGSENTEARQILITEVAPQSPADGVLQPGDVILGVDGQLFDANARVRFAQALTQAESTDNRGSLKLVRWRAGKTQNVQLKIKMLGTYAPTAPYDCAKSRRVFALGCEAIAQRGFRNQEGEINVSIENDMNALALLASEQRKYREMLVEYARAVAQFEPDPNGLPSWEFAYNTIFLAEYALATKDRSVMPGLQRLALEIARGSSGVGTWGHRFAKPDGNLYGYGAMNQTGIPLTLAMVLAREAGVQEPDLDQAITKSSAFLRQWVNKGAIPYGDHEAWPWHDDNGKCSGAAVLFDLLGDHEAAAFYSRMGTAAYAERESGHTGNFFNILWALPGVSRCGEAATAAYFQETAWYYDMARGWDGRVTYVGFPGEISYANWDCTGAYLLGFSLPLKSLFLTGRKSSVVPMLSADEVTETIAAGRGFSFLTAQQRDWYADRSTETLLAGLSSWSPAVRLRSAEAIKRRDEDLVPPLLELLAGQDPNGRYGACEALAKLGPRADVAAPQLRALLTDSDPWLRMLAVRAIACLGPEARNASVTDLFRVALLKDPLDRRRRLVGEVARALFSPMPGTNEPVPILAQSLEGVDRALLRATLKEVLTNEDGLIRGLAASVYPRLTEEDVQVLLPEIIEATRKNAASGEMFRYGIRWAGLDLLARFRIREGMVLCVEILNEIEWGREPKQCLEPLKVYGGAAKEVIPQLKATIVKLQESIQAQPRNRDSWSEEIVAIEKLIREIEADSNAAPVVSMADFMGKKVQP